MPHFELTPQLLKQIRFAMENQHELYVLDTRQSTLLPAASADAALDTMPDHLLPLPEWTSQDGFALMQEFALSIHNTRISAELNAILQSRKAVFRQFKDYLQQHKFLESRWHTTKDRCLEERIYEWYNELRETWGLPAQARPPHDSQRDQILLDFGFRQASTLEIPKLQELDAQVLQYHTQALRDDEAALFMAIARPPLGTYALDCTAVAIVAESTQGELAGFGMMQRYTLSGGHCIGMLQQLFVHEEYRGIGLGKCLLEEFSQLADNQGISYLLIALPFCPLWFRNYLERIGCKPHPITSLLMLPLAPGLEQK